MPFESDLPTTKAETAPASSGNLLALLTAVFYGLFTLLPDSNSLMVAWPWVFIWQVGLLCPVLWLLSLVWQRRGRWLGNRLDWFVGLLLVSLLISISWAQFPMQARWYGWATWCFLAALYALSSWLEIPQRRSQLLTAQGYLSLAFIIVSLSLWTSQTFLPELARLRSLQPYGVNLAFDFSNIELRNWAPIGHQNYVAGYLALALPLLLGLAISQSGWRRWLWSAGILLGLVDLYTTSSRAGWLAILLLAIVSFGLLLWRSALPRRWLVLSGGTGLTILILFIVANNRLRAVLTGILSGQASGELAYRLITVTTGWQMGLSHLLTGIGIGGVPLLYQSYRPAWAGREAEWAYQLHSTPAHLWAELGLWSVLLAGSAIVLLIALGIRSWRVADASLQLPRSLSGSLFAGLFAYGIVSLTDYQLDNVCLSGLLVVYLAVLAAELRDVSRNGSSDNVQSQPEKQTVLQKWLPFAGVGLLLVAGIWLIPIHRAWMLSSQGFAALNRKDINLFAQQLNQAQQLAPWEPYYAYQLGWNLAETGLKTSGDQQQVLMNDAITNFRVGNQVSPHQEFGRTNLGWLLVDRDAKAAMQEFVQAVQRVPAKRGGFYGLGVSLLAQGKTDLAVTAFSLEVLRDPVWIASPIWKLPQFQPLYTPVVNQLEARYSSLLAQAGQAEPLSTQLRQSRGAVRWWTGNLVAARIDWQSVGTPLSRFVLDLAEGKSGQAPVSTPASGGDLAIAAWLNPAQRQDLLRQAWTTANQTVPPPAVLQQLVESMSRSASFDQWLKQNAPSRQYRRERAGFGVLSRHIDGPIPLDFLQVFENIPIAQFFEQAKSSGYLFPSFVYAPELDKVLQPERDALLQTLKAAY